MNPTPVENIDDDEDQKVVSRNDDFFWDHQIFRRKLYDLRSQGLGIDVKLKSSKNDGGLVFAHMHILRMVKHFEDIFMENQMENGPAYQCIPVTILEDFDTDILDAAVRYIYTGEVDLVKFSILQDVLEASKFYGLPGFYEKYFDFHRSNLSTKNWKIYFTELTKNNLIDQYPDFLTAIFDTVRRMDLNNSIEFLTLYKTDFIVMLSASNRPFDSTKSAFKLIARWVAYSPIDRSGFIDELFDVASMSNNDNDTVVPKEEQPSASTHYNDNDNDNKNNAFISSNGILDSKSKPGQSKSTSNSNAKVHSSNSNKRKVTTKSKNSGQSTSTQRQRQRVSPLNDKGGPSQDGQSQINAKTKDPGQNSSTSTSIVWQSNDKGGPSQDDQSQIITKTEGPGQNTTTSSTSRVSSSPLNDKGGPSQDGQSQIITKTEYPGQNTCTTTSTSIISPSNENEIENGGPGQDGQGQLLKPKLPLKSCGKKRRRSRGRARTNWSQSRSKKPAVSAVLSALKIKKEKFPDSEDNDDNDDNDNNEESSDQDEEKIPSKKALIKIKQEKIDTSGPNDLRSRSRSKSSDEGEIEIVSIASDDGFHQRKHHWSTSELVFFQNKDGFECLMTYNFEKKVYNRAGLISIKGIQNMTLVSTTNKVYCIGGCLRTSDKGQGQGQVQESFNQVKSILIEDFGKARKPWSIEPSMIECRANCAAILIGNVIWVFGGDKNGDDVTNSIEKLDLSKYRSNWVENETHMEFSNEKLGVCLLGNRIYMIGGNGSKDSNGILKPHNFADCFDLVQKQFVPIEYMQEARQDVQVVACKNKVYAIGGKNHENDLNSVEVYDPTVNKWSYVAPCPFVCSSACAFNLDDIIYYIGKSDYGKPMIQSYNPETNNWAVLPNNLPDGADLSSCALIIKKEEK